MYSACSRAVVRCSALYVGSAREASGQAVLVCGRAPKVTSFGSWDMYSFALRGRVMGLHCMTLLIWKQLQEFVYVVCVASVLWCVILCRLWCCVLV